MPRAKHTGSDAWTAVYWGDLIKDTTHLEPVEFGIYMLLLAHYYSRGRPLPASASRLQTICRCKTEAHTRALDAVLDDFFTLDGDVYRNARADAELQKRKEISEKRAEAARRRHASADASAGTGAHANADASAQQKDTQPQPQPHGSTTTAPTTRPSAFGMHPEWEPDAVALSHHLRMLGVAFEDVPPDANGEFKSYWMAQDRKHTQAQWTQKLAKSIRFATVKLAGEVNGQSRRVGAVGGAGPQSDRKGWWQDVFRREA